MSDQEPHTKSCGAFLDSNGTCLWRVWAPRVKQLKLVLWNRQGERTVQPMSREAEGYFTFTSSGIEEGQRYAFDRDVGFDVPDPASRWQPDGVHAASAVWNPQVYRWNDNGWRGIARQELVIYELHVGTFTPEGTFAAIVPRLKSLRELGVTAIELLPVAQFPGVRNWGYDGVDWYAVQNSYGGPRELQKLVDACHAEGLGLILDVVYNHLGPEGNYLSQFGPYFSARYRTPWGEALNFDDRGSDHVRAFVLNNVRQWVRDFHVDGLRLDAIHAIFDAGARHILAEIKQAADNEAAALQRPVHIIAESNLNDVRLLRPREHGGYQLDAQWSDDFHHCVHTLLTGERDGYYADFDDPAPQLAKALNHVFVYDGRYSRFRQRTCGAPVGDLTGDRFVISIQTHDQVGNRAAGDRFGTLLSPAQQRLTASLMLLAPNVPMLFMGEEYGETHPFPFFCDFGDPQLQEAVRAGRREEFADFTWQGEVPDPLSEATFRAAKLTWEWPEGTWQAGLRRLYQDLLTFRREVPALRDFVHREAHLVDHNSSPGLLVLRRGDARRPEDVVEGFFNLSDRRAAMPERSHPASELIFSSEARIYAGAQSSPRDSKDLLPYEAVVFANRKKEPA